MSSYDLVITASCYMSPNHAIRLLNSISKLDGRVLPIITCPRLHEAKFIADNIADIQTDVVILHSVRRERHLCQDLGFVWCLANNIQARYLAFTDDDIEFVGPDIFKYLDKAPGFSTFGFASSTVPYGINPFQGTSQAGPYCFNPCWIDGHNIFTKWDTNLKCGVMDALPGAYNSSFVEMEYTHRLSLLSGQPSIGCKYYALHHHSRVDNVEQLRDAENQQSVVHQGYRLWEQKFGLTMDAGAFNSGAYGWNNVKSTLSQPEYASLYQRHMIFDGLWIDWDAIWNKYRADIQIIYEVLKMKTEIILGREVTTYDDGQIEIDKQKYTPFTGGALKLGNSFGYMYPWEILTLQVFVRSLPLDAIIINIGAGAGTSGLAMAEARMDLIPNIYTVDIANDGGPLGGLVPEQNAFKAYNTPFVNQILGDSYDVGMGWDKGPVDMVFVDGNHSSLGVTRDIEAWEQYIKNGGYMLFHDYGHEQWSGIKPVVDTLMSAHEQIAVIDFLTVYRIHRPPKRGRKAKVNE